MHESSVLHNSHESFFRSPFGAVPCSSKIRLKITICSKEAVQRVFLNLNNDKGHEEKLEMSLLTEDEGKRVYETELTVPSVPGLLWYYFILNAADKVYYYGNNHNHFGGEGELSGNIPTSYQVTVYKEETQAPEWFKHVVMYQIFPDRFYNGSDDGKLIAVKKNSVIHSNWEDTPIYIKYPDSGTIARWDFFGGNLPGVIKKLSYLKSLGITVIYFNPIFESASNHRYDTGDYKKIDPILGDLSDFEELCKKAEEMGIRIILDGVFSHTGSDSIYFNKEGNYSQEGAYQSKQSPYYSWYRFIEYPDKYESWWGIDNMPNTNESDPFYQNFIVEDEDSVLSYWMKKGAAGWRLDVADELPHAFIKKIRKKMKAAVPDSVLIGEVWEDASNKISYGKRREYLLGEELDSVTNYLLRRILLGFFLNIRDAVYTHNALMSIYENYPKHIFYCNMNLIGSHDVPRILTLLGEAPDKTTMSQKSIEQYKLTPELKELAVKRLKLMSLFQMTYPGVPCIYYGDEAGMEGFDDPLNRRTYPWGKEDEELLNWYKKIISIRNRHKVLRTGEWFGIVAKGDVYGYARQIKGEETAVILFNRNKNIGYTVNIDITGQFTKDTELLDLIDENKKIISKEGNPNIFLKPLEGKLFMVKGKIKIEQNV